MNLRDRGGGLSLFFWEAESLGRRSFIFVLRVVKERALLCAAAVVRVKRTGCSCLLLGGHVGRTLDLL